MYEEHNIKLTVIVTIAFMSQMFGDVDFKCDCNAIINMFNIFF